MSRSDIDPGGVILRRDDCAGLWGPDDDRPRIATAVAGAAEAAETDAPKFKDEQRLVIDAGRDVDVRKRTLRRLIDSVLDGAAGLRHAIARVAPLQADQARRLLCRTWGRLEAQKRPHDRQRAAKPFAKHFRCPLETGPLRSVS